VSKILIVGAGGHGQVVADMLLRAREAGAPEQVAGFLDDILAPTAPTVLGLPVLGALDSVREHDHDAIVVAIGENRDRARLFASFEALGEHFAIAVHPRSYVSPTADIGRGAMVCAGALVSTAACIGDDVILNTGSSVDHHCSIGAHAHIAPGAYLGGEVRVGDGALVGIGARVLPRVSIGPWAVVGSGAVVTEDVPAYATAVGIPARVVKRGDPAVPADSLGGDGASRQGLAIRAGGKAIAIMQPYFVPYAGYFRLFAASDLFVIYDDVQFTRRGWVHRNRLPNAVGDEHWLTLRLQKAPQDVLISELQFAPEAADGLERDLRRFPMLRNLSRSAPTLWEALLDVSGTPANYIERLLHSVTDYLSLPWNIIRSSSLNLPPSLRGQDRILEIVRLLGGTEYVNSSGGRGLYDPETFAEAGVALRFLPDYLGPRFSILGRIAYEPKETLARELRSEAAIGVGTGG
jgi:sugar O-acyltransferase (sialic acid O-acetyltransferase NeuD family)